MTRGMRLPAILFVAALLVGCASIIQKIIPKKEPAPPPTQKVTLKNGQTFEVVTTESGLPVRYNSKEIDILGFDINAQISQGQEDKIQLIWIVTAELREKGEFTVTVTTPIDERLSSKFAAKGPGKIVQRLFPRDDYPTVWEGVEEPGTHWFPFYFSFEEKASQKRFEFSQWAQIDSRRIEEIRARVQKQLEKPVKRP